jgi:hypothetical protein
LLCPAIKSGEIILVKVRLARTPVIWETGTPRREI